MPFFVHDRPSQPPTLRGCSHDTRVTIIPVQVHPGFLSWLCIHLHDTTRKCHTRPSHTGASSPQLLYQSKSLIPVQNLVTVPCKQRMTTTGSFSMKSASWWTGTGIAYVISINLSSEVCFWTTYDGSSWKLNFLELVDVPGCFSRQ